MLSRARGTFTVLCAIPMLGKHYTEKSVGEAVAPYTWEKDIDKLISNPMGQIAYGVWGGHFHMIKAYLLKCLVGRTFQDSGLTLMKAKVKFPSAGTKFKTWATFYSGDVCVTSAIPVPCIEEPPKGGSLFYDGPKVDTWQGDFLHKGMSTINKTLVLFRKVSIQGLN